MRVATRVVAGAAVVASLLVAPARAGGCPHVRRAGPWTTIDSPLPPAAAAVVSLGNQPKLVLDPVDAKVMVVSSGRALYRTGDGGCTWQTVLDLSSGGAPEGLYRADATYAIVRLVTTPQRWMYATIVDTASSLTAPMPAYLAVSKDAGRTWEVPDPLPAADPSGLTPLCTSAHIGVAPSDPSTVYMVCRDDSISLIFVTAFVAQLREGVYVTRDAGRTWRRSAGTGYIPTQSGALRPIVVDATNPRRVWTAAGGPLGQPDVIVSNDGGDTWSKSATVYGTGMHLWGGASVRGPRSRTMIWSSAGIIESFNDGKTWNLVKPVNPGGQEGPLQGVAYERGGASMFSLQAYNVGYTFTDADPFPSCTERHRIARRYDSSSRWRVLAPPRSSPAGAVYQLYSFAAGRAGYGTLARVYPTDKDCKDYKTPKAYVMVFTG